MNPTCPSSSGTTTPRHSIPRTRSSPRPPVTCGAGPGPEGRRTPGHAGAAAAGGACSSRTCRIWRGTAWTTVTVPTTTVRTTTVRTTVTAPTAVTARTTATAPTMATRPARLTRGTDSSPILVPAQATIRGMSTLTAVLLGRVISRTVLARTVIRNLATPISRIPGRRPLVTATLAMRNLATRTPVMPGPATWAPGTRPRATTSGPPPSWRTTRGTTARPANRNWGMNRRAGAPHCSRRSSGAASPATATQKAGSSPAAPGDWAGSCWPAPQRWASHCTCHRSSPPIAARSPAWLAAVASPVSTSGPPAGSAVSGSAWARWSARASCWPPRQARQAQPPSGPTRP